VAPTELYALNYPSASLLAKTFGVAGAKADELSTFFQLLVHHLDLFVE
jgi:hypothetical protein